MKAYKLMRLRKDGTFGSLFINRKESYPIGVWMEALDYPTKGYQRRFGWHCTFKPIAPHLTLKGRVWVEVEVDEFVTLERPLAQGGKWILARLMLINKLYKESE